MQTFEFEKMTRPGSYFSRAVFKDNRPGFRLFRKTLKLDFSDLTLLLGPDLQSIYPDTPTFAAQLTPALQAHKDEFAPGALWEAYRRHPARTGFEQLLILERFRGESFSF